MQLEWGGILYASEALLALVAIWEFFTRLMEAQFWRPPFTRLMLVLGVTMLAYVVIRESACGRYALLLNPDVICIAGLLDRLVAFLDAHPEAAIAAPQLYYPDGAIQPNVRRFPTPAALALRALRVDALWKSPGVRRYLMHGESLESTQVDWVTGAVLMVRRTAIEDVGLLDENYFLYWEDLDWCYRMRQAGWTVHRVAEARAIHIQAREGARRPFSRAGRAQLTGAVRFFRKFGWNAGRAA